jgi:hypothetical protein
VTRRLAALVGTAAVGCDGGTPVMIALSTLPDTPERVVEWLRRLIEA